MIRHAFQLEGYGLTPAQRTTGAAAVNTALDSENVSEVSNRTVNANYVKRGSTLLFVEVDFSAQAAGQRVFDIARNWLDGKAVDAANGEKSYVRVRSIDYVEMTIVQRYAESPGWVMVLSNENLRPA